MCGNVSGVIVLQDIVSESFHSHSESVHSHSSGLLACPVCCLVWIIIPYKEAFHILWYRTVQKVHCLMRQVQLTVPVCLHNQRNICCKTWHKKLETEICIGCHTLYWQIYQQWTDETLCVAPACCLHTVRLGIVCDSWDITLKYHLCCNFRRPSAFIHRSSPFVHPLIDICDCFASSHKPVRHRQVTATLFTDTSCGNVGQYQLNSNIDVFVFVCVCAF